MLGIIVCQLQPSKSTFEIIKENFLFICLFVVLPYFFYLVRTKSPNRDNPAKTKSFGLVPCLLLTQEIISEWRGTNPLTLGVGKEERNGEGIEERGKVSHPSPLCFFVFHSLPSAFCAYQACGRNIFSAFLFRGMGGGGGRNLCPRHIGQNKILVWKLSESCRLYLCSFLTYHEETVEGSVIYPDCLDPNKSAKNHDLSLCVAIYQPEPRPPHFLRLYWTLL